MCHDRYGEFVCNYLGEDYESLEISSPCFAEDLVLECRSLFLHRDSRFSVIGQNESEWSLKERGGQKKDQGRNMCRIPFRAISL